MSKNPEVRIGSLVKISTVRPLDCCNGKRGWVTRGNKDAGWIVNTDHFCPVLRDTRELTVIPVETQAREYFEIEGTEKFAKYVKMVKSGQISIDEIKQHAIDDLDATCRHFLILFELGINEL